jgi:hypothetical protein
VSTFEFTLALIVTRTEEWARFTRGAMRVFRVLAALQGAEESTPTHADLTPAERRQGFVWDLSS